MDKRVYRRRPNEAEKEALLCYKYYNSPGSHVCSIDGEKGETVVVDELFSLDMRNEDIKVYSDYCDDPPGTSELESMREAMFLSKPCGEDVEARVRSILDSLPVFPDGDLDGLALSLDPLPELGCEVFAFADFREDADADTPMKSYCFPAGFAFNLAMESAAGKLGIDGCLWGMDEFQIKRMRADYLSGRESDREAASRADALVGMVQLTSALLSARERFTWGVLNDWLDMIPYKPSPSQSSTRYWEMFGEHILRDAKRGKPTALPTSSTDNIETVRTKEAMAAEAFPHVDVSGNPKEVRCLMDVFYYTLRAHAVRNNHGNAYRCPSCGRLFFQGHGRQTYCLFRSPDPDYQSDSCQEAVKKICAKRYSEVKRLRDVIANTLSKPHRESMYPDDAYNKFIEDYDEMSAALGKRKELEERLEKYRTQLEWLNAEYLKLFGRKYVPKERKK